MNSTNQEKIYRMYGIDVAIQLLRPGAKWEVTNSNFTRWDDSRPQPTWEEVTDTMKKIKAFEDSINTIWLPEQIKAIESQFGVYMETQKQVQQIVEQAA